MLEFPDRALLEIITQRKSTLRKSDKKVADVVLKDPIFAMNASMAEIAAAAGVSEPTVMRFCTSVGCRSFQKFKLRLAQSIAFGIPATHSAIEPGDTTERITAKIFDYTISSLDRARRKLDDNAIGKAIELMAGAKRIEFFGFGASNIVAQDAQQKFPLFGVPCLVHTDWHQQFISASLSGPGDVAVVISNTGQTSGAIEIAKICRANGANVIGLSGWRSPLLEECSVKIVVETLENTDLYTPTISRIAALVVIDILATGVALRHSENYIESVSEMKARLRAMRTAKLQYDVSATPRTRDP
ncbi:MAG: SIS domain-containing protein [Alphaproteobacteria bacterium]